MDKNSLEDFMNGFGAAVQLLNRAGQNGFIVEYVCLATSVIDAMLRIGIILKHQINSQTDEVLEELLCMEEEDKPIYEREIYKKSLDNEVINNELFALLNSPYDQRNKVIHRYIISRITTRNILDIGIQYEKIIPIISRKISKLEEKQTELGVGMCVPTSDITRFWIDRMIAKKHGDSNLAKGLD